MVLFYNYTTDINILNSSCYYLGTSTSFDLKSRFPNDYANFTNNNFLVFPDNNSQTTVTQIADLRRIDCAVSVSKNYNASSGILSCSGTMNYSVMSSSDTSYFSRNINCVAYLVVGDIK